MDGKTTSRDTAQRQLILGAVKELSHPSAEEVFGYVSLQRPSIGKATVYRNLNRMAQSREILNVGSFSGCIHYDHNCHDHHHFVCESCGRIFDVKGDFSDLRHRIEENQGFDVTSCKMHFSGICRSCKDEGNS